MKTFKKIQFAQNKMSHAEMKKITGGNYGGYACGTFVETSGIYTVVHCSSAMGLRCWKDDDSTGTCASSIYNGPGYHYPICNCE